MLGKGMAVGMRVGLRVGMRVAVGGFTRGGASVAGRGVAGGIVRAGVQPENRPLKMAAMVKMPMKCVLVLSFIFPLPHDRFCNSLSFIFVHYHDRAVCPPAWAPRKGRFFLFWNIIEGGTFEASQPKAESTPGAGWAGLFLLSSHQAMNIIHMMDNFSVLIRKISSFHFSCV